MFFLQLTLLVSCFFQYSSSLRGLIPRSTTITRVEKSVQQSQSNSITHVAGLLAVCVLTIGMPLTVLAVDAEETFVGNVATMITAKRILEPVDNFVELSAYDNARTNVKYILNQLQLQKNADSLVRLSLDFTEDPDRVDAATEAAGRVTTTAQNVDSRCGSRQYPSIRLPSSN